MRTIFAKILYADEDGKRAELFLRNASGREYDDQLGITVTKEKRFGSKNFDPARVNWSGCGPMSSEYATDYARAILYGVQLATEWDAADEAERIAR